MLAGTFIDTLVWVKKRSYGSVQDRIKVSENCIEVSKIKVYKITQTQIFIPVILFFG